MLSLVSTNLHFVFIEPLWVVSAISQALEWKSRVKRFVFRVSVTGGLGVDQVCYHHNNGPSTCKFLDCI